MWELIVVITWSHFCNLLNHVCDFFIAHVLAALECIGYGDCGSHRCGVHPHTSVQSRDTLKLEVLAKLGGHVTRWREQSGNVERLIRRHTCPILSNTFCTARASNVRGDLFLADEGHLGHWTCRFQQCTTVPVRHVCALL